MSPYFLRWQRARKRPIQQLETLLTTITNAVQPPSTAPPPQQQPLQMAGGDPASLGPMQPCALGLNKMTLLQRFESLLE